MKTLRAIALALPVAALAFAGAYAAEPSYEVNPPLSAETLAKMQQGQWVGDPSGGDLEFRGDCQKHRPNNFFQGLMRGYSCFGP